MLSLTGDKSYKAFADRGPQAANTWRGSIRLCLWEQKHLQWHCCGPDRAEVPLLPGPLFTVEHQQSAMGGVYLRQRMSFSGRPLRRHFPALPQHYSVQVCYSNSEFHHL